MKYLLYWTALGFIPAIAPVLPAAPGTVGDHRLRIGGRSGYGELSSALLEEANHAWPVNSALAAAGDKNKAPVVPVVAHGPGKYVSRGASVDYAYRDRWFFAYRFYYINQEFPREGSTKITYFQPGTNRLHRSLFEGIRLQNLEERRENLDLCHMRPTFIRGFNAGACIEHERFREIADLSFGSLVSVRKFTAKKPDHTYWSNQAFVPARYEMQGLTAGLILRLQLTEYLGFFYRFTPVIRQGSFRMAGVQFLEEKDDATGYRAIRPVVPLAAGEVRDRGARQSLEAVLRLYCYFGLHLGVLREDIVRRYDFYAGETFPDRDFLHRKTGGLGIGETNTDFHGSKLEIYIRLSAAVFW